MEPNKIEKQFRDKLNAREIQPSAQAWDRLDAMLSIAEEKKTRKPFGFLFIAASILVFVTLGLFLFNQNGIEVKPENSVVGTETEKDTVQNSVTDSQKTIVEAPKANEVVASTSNQPETRNPQPATRNSQLSTNNIIIKDKEIEYQNSSDVAQKDLPKIMERKEIMLTKEIKAKSDDNLLADLDKTIKQSANTKSAIKVDAKSLLSQVDGEVELSFREKVFTKVNKNYKEVKVALANRNNQ
ncbi:hypothetical protein ACSVH2_04455 [Flavobacterium sp. RSB2_4_14]|uniref:hypothetical protein n=1 Tax=Flavobacterium sp. RSB2_4_14 TaxID=3447665 RepID=UPI003F3E8B49